MKNLSLYVLILASFLLGGAVSHFKFEQNLSSKINECYSMLTKQVMSGHSDIIDVSRNNKYETFRYYVLGRVYVCAFKYKHDK